jgi:hypothetical protein
MQGTRNRRGGERQDIDLLAEAFDFFFMGDPEAVFLIDHQQA